MSQGRIQLEVIEGSRVIDTRAFAGTVIEIGKLSKSDFVLKDDSASRRHARIEIDAEGRVHLLDLESTNGTKLNGMRVGKSHLTDGDEIEIGLTRLRVRFDAELKRVAQMNAPSSRTTLTRDGFYSSQDDAKRGGLMAIETALLWEDVAIQADSFRRSSLSPRFAGFMLLLFAFTPIPLFAGAVFANVAGASTLALTFATFGFGFLINFAMDVTGWRHMVTDSIARMKRGETVYIGETAGSRFFLPSEALGSKEHPLLVPNGDGWGLDLGLEGIKGDLLVDGKVISLDDARLTGLLRGGVLPMQPGSKARLRFGQFSMLLSYVNEPRTARPGLFTGGGIQEFAYVALSAIVHFSVLILFVYLQPEDEIQIRRPKSPMIARLIAVESIKNKEKEKKKEEKEEEELPEKVEIKEDEVALDADPTPAVTETEKLTPTEKPKVADARPNPRTGPRIPMTEEQKKVKTEQTSRIAKATAEKYIPTDMLASVTGKNLLSGPKGSGLNMKVIAGGAGAVDDGGGSAGAMGNYAGGGTEGQGGYAAMDFGGNSGVAGTGGTGVGGPGGPVVAGLDKDGGGGNRLKAGGLVERELKAIVASAGEATTSGGLTKKIIQQYMDRQKGQIVSCYKREIQKNPNLEGKVVVAFTISPTGKVMSPSIRSSTLGSSPVEQCIVSKLGLFKFPAPDNAGAVKVTYPFLFRTR